MSSRTVSRRRVLQVAGLAGVATSARLSGLAWAEGSEPLAELRAGGLAVLMRHARTTAGSGDPPGYRLEDCATQRNLDDAGRAQAARVGQWFAKNGLRPTRVRNSPWCRARDTARLAFGRFDDWAALGNIFDRDLQPSHVAEVRAFVAQLKPGEFAVLVSHGVTIGALAGAHPAPAEGVLVRARSGEALQIVGRLVAA
jgi:phosphohistidine phosphatase SixA